MKTALKLATSLLLISTAYYAVFAFVSLDILWPLSEEDFHGSSPTSLRIVYVLVISLHWIPLYFQTIDGISLPERQNTEGGY
jgi:hypothetical protein